MPQDNPPRRDRHGRRDSTATANTNATGPRSTTRPSKTVGKRRGRQAGSLIVEVPENDPQLTPAAARALLRLVLNVAKKKQLRLPEGST
jgi:hypothetical protein